jgi:hypothetical protein
MGFQESIFLAAIQALLREPLWERRSASGVRQLHERADGPGGLREPVDYTRTHRGVRPFR